MLFLFRKFDKWATKAYTRLKIIQIFLFIHLKFVKRWPPYLLVFFKYWNWIRSGLRDKIFGATPEKEWLCLIGYLEPLNLFFRKKYHILYPFYLGPDLEKNVLWDRPYPLGDWTWIYNIFLNSKTLYKLYFCYY